MITSDKIIEVARKAAEKVGHTLRAEPSMETVEFIEAFYNLAFEAGASAENEGCEDILRAEVEELETIAKGLDIQGEYDAASSIFSTSWKISMCAVAIRERRNK